MNIQINKIFAGLLMVCILITSLGSCSSTKVVPQTNTSENNTKTVENTKIEESNPKLDRVKNISVKRAPTTATKLNPAMKNTAIPRSDVGVKLQKK